MSVELSGEQKHVVIELVKGIRRKSLPVQTFGGYGGTGKTTVVSYLTTVLPNFAVAAFTGKAASILRRKGVATASTIHSLIYKPFTNADGTVEFVMADSLEYDGIIVDEASMVSAEIDADLRSFGLPIIYVGDHGQLPPVGDDFNLMADPMYRLETIHRNAGPIAHFCQWVRQGNQPIYFPSKMNVGGKVKFIKDRDVPGLLNRVDQTICAFNRTRVELNTKARLELGFTDGPQAGERVMCLRNNRKAGIYNGMQGIIVDLWKQGKKHYLCLESYGEYYENIRYDPEQFNKESIVTKYSKDGPIPFDFSTAITCHKAQGDQFGTVLVVEQVCKAFDRYRWGYTAGSRAENELLWKAA